MKFSIKDFFGKCDQIRSFLWIWSHLLKKSLMDNFILCSVNITFAIYKMSLIFHLLILDSDHKIFMQNDMSIFTAIICSIITVSEFPKVWTWNLKFYFLKLENYRNKEARHLQSFLKFFELF